MSIPYDDIEESVMQREHPFKLGRRRSRRFRVILIVAARSPTILLVLWYLIGSGFQIKF